MVAPQNFVPAAPAEDPLSLPDARPTVTAPPPAPKNRSWPVAAIFVAVVVTIALAVGVGAGWVLNAATPAPTVKGR